MLKFNLNTLQGIQTGANRFSLHHLSLSLSRWEVHGSYCWFKYIPYLSSKGLGALNLRTFLTTTVSLKWGCYESRNRDDFFQFPNSQRPSERINKNMACTFFCKQISRTKTSDACASTCLDSNLYVTFINTTAVTIFDEPYIRWNQLY